MGKIQSYGTANSPISGSDKLIGTDSADNNATKNFTISEIQGFIQPYAVYTALLTQEGTADPVATVLQNTLGDISWFRDSDGFYYAYSASGVFTEGYTFVTITHSNFNIDGTTPYFYDSPNYILVSTLDTNWDYVDNVLYGTSVEIRVYNS